jgi:hypothetical protein
MTTQTVRGTDLVVKLDGEDQMPALDMMEEKPTKKTSAGKDEIVYLVGEDQTPTMGTMEEKLTVGQVKEKYGEDTTVFLCNKNLHKVPKGLRGSIVWLPLLAIIATVVYSKDFQAQIIVLYPRSKKGEKKIIDLTICRGGQFLDHVTGLTNLRIDTKHRSAKQDGVTLVDRRGQIKMNIEGPDIILPEEGMKVSEMKSLISHSCVFQPPPLKKCKRFKKPCSVDVVYIYREHPEDFKVVTTYLEDASLTNKDIDFGTLSATRIQTKPVFSIPFGDPFHISNESNRYVKHLEWS